MPNQALGPPLPPGADVIRCNSRITTVINITGRNISHNGAHRAEILSPIMSSNMRQKLMPIKLTNILKMSQRLE